MTTAMGRPTLLRDRQRLTQVLRMVRQGVPITTAAVSAGIGERTYMRWMATARTAERKLEEGLTLTDSERLAHDFWQLSDRASARFLALTVATALRLAELKGQPSVLSEILSRHPDHRREWRPSTAVELSGRDGGPIELERVSDMTDEELSARLERLRRIADERRDAPPD